MNIVEVLLSYIEKIREQNVAILEEVTKFDYDINIQMNLVYFILKKAAQIVHYFSLYDCQETQQKYS